MSRSVMKSMKFRVLALGRIGISDVVAEDDLSPEGRAERGSLVGCVAGSLGVTFGSLIPCRATV